MRKVQLLVDLGGPLMTDSKVEGIRKTTVLGVAKEAGIIDEMSRANPDVLRVDEADFESAYEKGKAYLKEVSAGAEAYNDVARLSAALSISIQTDYRRLVEAPSPKSIERFWEGFCGPIREAAVESMQVESLRVIREMLVQNHDIAFHIVSDNWPELFHRAFEPAIRKRFAEHGLPEMEYRCPSLKREKNNCIYISGEGWGNKKFPSTWKGILTDLDVEREDVIYFVDDSAKKLSGLSRYAQDAGMNSVHPVHLCLGGEGKTDYVTIASMKELANVIKI